MTELDFQTLLTSVRSNEILIPSVHKKLFSPSFQGFPVQVEPWTPHPYDGWFHPSAHATWTVRQLYLYLTASHLLEEEQMPITGVFAVTVGKFWHLLLQMIWRDDGILDQAEVPAEDPTTNRRGHADGLLGNGELVEIKSINAYQIEKVTNESELKTKKFSYWAQSQDYLDMLGADAMRYFVVHPAWPFPMKEFVVRADTAYQRRRRDEYQLAVHLAAKYPDPTVLDDPTEIEACCGPGSATAKKCPTRSACPIGRFTR